MRSSFRQIGARYSLKKTRPRGPRLHCAYLLTAVTFFSSACAGPSPEPTLPATDVGSVPIADQNDGEFNLFDRYVLQPADVVDLFFQTNTWERQDDFRIKIDHTVAVKFVHSPELNETQRVRPDGKISLPYLGEYDIVDKTIVQIRQELEQAYEVVLEDPEIYVVVPEFNAAINELRENLRSGDRGLSKLIHVMPDGRATFPLIGEMMVANRTISQVDDELNEKYARLFNGLQVNLALERHAGSKVYVLGEVNEPGAYEMTRPVTLIQSLALAGSVLPHAQVDSIVLARRESNQIIASQVNMNDARSLGGTEDPIYLQPDDIVFVPRTRLSSAAEVSRNLADVLMFRGWGLYLNLLDAN